MISFIPPAAQKLNSTPCSSTFSPEDVILFTGKFKEPIRQPSPCLNTRVPIFNPWVCIPNLILEVGLNPTFKDLFSFANKSESVEHVVP